MTVDLSINPHYQKEDGKYSYLVDSSSLAKALENILQVPEYLPSPLLDCASLAREFGLARISCKYEGDRFAGGSFKPLGVANAVIEIAKRMIELDSSLKVSTAELFGGKFHEELASLTFTCATSGNHGYALAWIARRLGAQCRIYCPANTSHYRKTRIEALGAQVVEVSGTFDEAVALCSEESRNRGDIVVSNLIQEGLEDIPQLIMNGYAVLAQEVMKQIDTPITHIFVGGGGGRLAASICAAFKIMEPHHLPKVIVVEPQDSNCIARSIESDEAALAQADANSIMTGLVVAKPSAVSWPILRTEVFATMTISDEAAVDGLLDLRNGKLGRDFPPIGETGIAAFAGFLKVMGNPELVEELSIDSTSHVLVIACEGVTDPELLASILKTPNGVKS